MFFVKNPAPAGFFLRGTLIFSSIALRRMKKISEACMVLVVWVISHYLNGKSDTGVKRLCT